MAVEEQDPMMMIMMIIDDGFMIEWVSEWW